MPGQARHDDIIYGGSEHVGCLCVVFRVLRGFDFDTGEGRHRGRQLESRNCGAHGGRARHGVARRIRDRDGGRRVEHRQKELALPRGTVADDEDVALSAHRILLGGPIGDAADENEQHAELHLESFKQKERKTR